jgi:mono/diheme cytochrome c family protein
MQRPPYRLVAQALAALLVALAQGGCAPGFQAPPVSPALARAARAPVAELERGYLIHQAKCAKCHGFENPADYPLAELRDEIMPAMAQKSKLAPADERALLAYVLAVRNLPPADPAPR